LESIPVPENNEHNGFGGRTNGADLTVPLAQHNLEVLFLYFNTLNCGHATLIDPITTDWSAL